MELLEFDHFFTPFSHVCFVAKWKLYAIIIVLIRVEFQYWILFQMFVNLLPGQHSNFICFTCIDE